MTMKVRITYWRSTWIELRSTEQGKVSPGLCLSHTSARTLALLWIWIILSLRLLAARAVDWTKQFRGIRSWWEARLVFTKVKIHALLQYPFNRTWVQGPLLVRVLGLGPGVSGLIPVQVKTLVTQSSVSHPDVEWGSPTHRVTFSMSHAGASRSLPMIHHGKRWITLSRPILVQPAR